MKVWTTNTSSADGLHNIFEANSNESFDPNQFVKFGILFHSESEILLTNCGLKTVEIQIVLFLQIRNKGSAKLVFRAETFVTVVCVLCTDLPASFIKSPWTMGEVANIPQ